ncbi:trypsin-like peptidase domain-containing protein [Lysinibacillus sphaericus]|uniref:ABC-three component system protein n=1 Tax=Lysinibacillus sphaericus TaxID=1421 RepID=UPI001E5FEA05|nr:ABC-three component system protein [Lysinibacillus sphaericus]UDK97561.1 trypsin-like peptidase domain-containing protein [Lysinibacillus sphaericus]
MEIHKKGAIARLDGPNGEIATAFLINPKYALTVKHVFNNREEGSNYKLCFPQYSQDTKYDIEKVDYDDNKAYNNFANDIAILQLKDSIEHIAPLSIEFHETESIGEWLSYGFPYSKREDGEQYKGTINNYLPDNLNKKYDINLFCKEPTITDHRYQIQGASGSPICNNNSGNVFAIFTNEANAGIIGVASLKRSKTLIEKYVTIPQQTAPRTELQEAILEAAETTKYLIEGFPDEIQDYLLSVLDNLVEQLQENEEDLQYFLNVAVYPVEENTTLLDGLKEMLEIILLIKSKYQNLKFQKEDELANINVEAELYMSIIYALRRNDKMPRILLEMNKKIMQKSIGPQLLKLKQPIPPYPIIFANCTSSTKYNLCKNCGGKFEFKEIIKTFLKPENEGYYMGIEDNNLDSLSKVNVICSTCLRELQNEVASKEELVRKVEEKIYGKSIDSIS